jgi:hypothetical protein
MCVQFSLRTGVIAKRIRSQILQAGDQFPHDIVPVSLIGVQPLASSQKIVELSGGKDLLQPDRNDHKLALKCDIELTGNVN